MGKKFVDLANLKSNLENFFSEIISPTFVTKEAVTEQLGNHTVKSDVPENAVFTDTVYDDAEVKENIAELNNNLDTLEYGEIAGGKNLFNGKYIQSVLFSEVDYTNRNLYNEFPSVSDITGLKYIIFGRYFKKGTYTFSYSNNNFLSLNRTAIAGSSCVVSSDVIRKSYTWTQDVDGYTYFTIEADESETSTTDILFKGTPDIQIEEGLVATDYEPYFPSNKMLAEEKADKSETTVNRLNPKLQTTTKDGVTCTNNGDGTYTLNGTAVSTTYFFVQGITYLAKNTTNKYYKLVGCPTGGMNKYDLRYEINGSTANGGGKDFGNGVIIKNDKINSTDITSAEIIITVLKDVTVNNLVFKPMLTTNLDATYDDFVPYTGDTGKLNSDVAEVRKDINSIIPADTSSITLTVTNSDIKEYVPSITFSREADSEKGIKTVNLSLTVGSGSGNVTGISGTLNEEELQKLQSMKIPTLFTNGNIIAFFGISQGTSKTYRFNLMLYIKNPEGEIGVYNNHSPVKESISIKSLL